jgi:hypothetical protein
LFEDADGPVGFDARLDLFVRVAMGIADVVAEVDDQNITIAGLDPRETTSGSSWMGSRWCRDRDSKTHTVTKVLTLIDNVSAGKA